MHLVALGISSLLNHISYTERYRETEACSMAQHTWILGSRCAHGSNTGEYTFDEFSSALLDLARILASGVYNLMLDASAVIKDFST